MEQLSGRYIPLLHRFQPKPLSACRSSPWCISSSSDTADLWKHLSFFPASPLKKDLEYSRAPSLRQGYAVLAISTTTDSSATLLSVSPFRRGTYRAYLRSWYFYQGQGGFPQLLLLLSIRVAADTPPPFFSLLANVGKRILSSPNINRLDQWSYTFTRLHPRSRKLRPGYSLTGLTPTLSMGFRRQRFHRPLPSKLRGSGFYHDGTFTR
jgi:hypothetical protein